MHKFPNRQREEGTTAHMVLGKERSTFWMCLKENALSDSAMLHRPKSMQHTYLKNKKTKRLCALSIPYAASQCLQL